MPYRVLMPSLMDSKKQAELFTEFAHKNNLLTTQYCDRDPTSYLANGVDCVVLFAFGNLNNRFDFLEADWKDHVLNSRLSSYGTNEAFYRCGNHNKLPPIIVVRVLPGFNSKINPISVNLLESKCINGGTVNFEDKTTIDKLFKEKVIPIINDDKQYREIYSRITKLTNNRTPWFNKLVHFIECGAILQALEEYKKMVSLLSLSSSLFERFNEILFKEAQVFHLHRMQEKAHLSFAKQVQDQTQKILQHSNFPMIKQSKITKAIKNVVAAIIIGICSILLSAPLPLAIATGALSGLIMHSVFGKSKIEQSLDKLITCMTNALPNASCNPNVL